MKLKEAGGDSNPRKGQRAKAVQTSSGPVAAHSGIQHVENGQPYLGFNNGLQGGKTSSGKRGTTHFNAY